MDIQIRHYTGNEIQVEILEIGGKGDYIYPILIIPVKFTIIPESLGEKLGLILFYFRCELFLEKDAHRIAETICFLNEITQFKRTKNINIEFPLDPFRIKRIEEKRIGDLSIKLHFKLYYGITRPVLLQINGTQSKKFNIVVEYENTSAELPLTIPQSHWVKKILPSLSINDYFLVEIPTGEKVIQEAWKILELAENAFSNWNSKGVYANCREVGSHLDGVLKAKYGADSFIYKEKWGRAYGKFNHYASLDLHLEDLRKSSKYSSDIIQIRKHDAEHLIIITKALIKYAEHLLETSLNPSDV